LFSAATSTKGRIVIVRFLGVDPSPDDRASASEQLDKTAFELMSFVKVRSGYLCWIYCGDRLTPLPNVAQTTLLNSVNLSYLPSDEDSEDEWGL